MRERSYQFKQSSNMKKWNAFEWRIVRFPKILFIQSALFKTSGSAGFLTEFLQILDPLKDIHN